MTDTTTPAAAGRGPLRWLADRGIRTKLRIPVGITAVAALTVGWLALAALNRVSESGTALAQDGVVHMQYLADARAAMLRGHADAVVAQVYPDPALRSRLAAAAAAEDVVLDRAIAQYRPGGGEEAELMSGFTAALADYRRARSEELAPALRRGDLAAAAKIYS